MKLKEAVGLLIIVFGVLLAVYCGVVWALVGGFIIILEQIRAEEISAMMVTWGLLRMLFSWMIGWVIFFTFTAIGVAVAE